MAVRRRSKVTRLQRSLAKMAPVVTDQLRDDMQEVAEVVRHAAMDLAPKDTGDMAAAIEAKVARQGVEAKVGYITKRSRRDVGWRAVFQEFGTQKAPAKPFLRPAMLRSRGDLIEMCDQAVDKAVVRYLAATPGGKVRR